MTYDLSQIETRDLRLCAACQAQARAQDKFCRRCGAQLSAPWPRPHSGATFCTAPFTTPVYQRVSAPLVAAITTGVAAQRAQLQSQLAQRIVSALIALPIWLLLVLLSPFDAYLTARTIIKQV